MVKMIGLFKRRPGMSLEEFERHWRNVYGPMARRHAKALGVKRYVQVMRTPTGSGDESMDAHAWAGDYDAWDEMWWESKEDMLAAFKSPEGQAAREQLGANEKMYMDPSSEVFLFGQEHVVFDDLGPGH